MTPYILKGKEKSLEWYFCGTTSIPQAVSVQEGKEQEGKEFVKSPHTFRVLNVPYVPLKFDSEEMRKLQEADPQYAQLIKNVELKNETSKEEYSLDPCGTLCKEMKHHIAQDHPKCMPY